jgi:hypothetical protein
MVREALLLMLKCISSGVLPDCHRTFAEVTIRFAKPELTEVTPRGRGELKLTTVEVAVVNLFQGPGQVFKKEFC